MRLLLLFIFLTSSVYGQVSEIITETWYLRYISIQGEQQFVPLGEDLNLSFFDDNGTLNAEANGIENTFNAEANFAGNTLELINPNVSSQPCNSENCFYEEFYFYDFLTDFNLENKIFTFQYHEYSSGLKDFAIRDTEFSIAYFTNQPIVPDSNIFQTWYLYESAVDLGDSEYFYGPDVPQITINPDFTFNGINGEIEFVGEFTYGEEFVVDFILVLESLSNHNTGIPDLVDFVPLRGYVDTNNFRIESAAGFYSSFRNEITLSVPEQEIGLINIYPNPTKGLLKIEALEPIKELAIYSILGEIVFSEKEIDLELDISFLKSGVYILVVTTEFGILTKKLIKQ